MFTGLVEDVGTLVAIQPQGRGKRLRLRTAINLHDVAEGASIAVNGACLTAETFHGDAFEVVAGAETLAKTTVGRLRVGDRVHLERALALGDRLDGHLVQGHVDGVGKVVSSVESAESWVLRVDVGMALRRYVAAKGSICLDGVSLTVNEVDGSVVRVNVVPHTAKVTRLAGYTPGDPVNVEVDVLAKYVERLLGDRASDGVSLSLLQRHGFA